MLTQDEANAINLLGQQASQVQQQLNAIRASQLAMIALLEAKYNAKFNKATGAFEPNDGPVETEKLRKAAKES